MPHVSEKIDVFIHSSNVLDKTKLETLPNQESTDKKDRTQNDINTTQGALPFGVSTNQQHKSQPVPASSTNHPGHPSGSVLIIIIVDKTNLAWLTIKSQNTNYKILTG